MLVINQAVALLKYAEWISKKISSPFLLKIESKKLDFKEKAKPKTDSGIHETMTSGGGGDGEASASATVNDEHQNETETSQNNGDQ